MRHSLAMMICSTLVVCAASPKATTHEIDEGLELGASLTVSSTDPVQAVMTLKPTIAFKTAVIELPNVRGGAQVACRFGALVPGQRYVCNVTGSVADDDSGLVIAISGVRSVAVPGHDEVAFKAFTVPNPRFDAAAVQAKKEAATKKKGATLQTTPRETTR